MTKDEFRALQEQAHLLEELTKAPGWDVFVDFAMHRMGAKQRQVLGGNVASLEEYKKLTGWLEGVEDTINASVAVRKMVDTEAPNQAA